MAADLREIMAALKIASDLERIGDLAKNIAKRTHRAQRRTSCRCSLMPGSATWAQLAQADAQGRARRLCATATPTRRSQVWRSRRGDRRRMYNTAVPRAPHLHDGRPAQHRALHPSAVHAPRTSSASATTPPTSPRPSITWCTGEPLDAERGRKATPRPALRPRERRPTGLRTGRHA